MNSRDNTNERIKAAMRDLRDRGRVCTRQVLSELLGLKLQIIDDHIKRMKDTGVVRGVVNGVFELAEENYSDRPVSATYLTDGRVKIEVGDDMLTVSMRECQRLNMATGGVFLQFVAIK